MRVPHAEVAVEGVVKRYGATTAVRGVSYTVEPGHVLSLLGPSGCGKTTLLRMIAGLITPSAGRIAVAGRDVTGVPVHRRNIGMLFQNYALFPHLTVAQNLAFGLEMRRVPKTEIAARVREALDLVRLAGLAERLPHALSGGQQQRVGLARALIVEPTILLLDEPFGALDKKLRESMQVEMRALQQRLGITTIMVTHDQDEALTLSDRVAVMRDGLIEQFGTPREVYERPETRFVADFVGTSNFVEGAVTRRDGGYWVTGADGLVLSLDGTPPAGPRATVALRPESIRLTSASDEAADPNPSPNRLRTTVAQVVYHGVSTHYHLARPGAEPIVAIRQNAQAGAPVAPGTEVLATWEADRNRLVREA